MICFADTEIPSRWKKLTICCPQACRPQAVWNQKVDDADSQLPHHQPIRKMSMGQFAPCNPLPQVSGYYLGFPRCSVVKNPLANAEGAGGADSIPESGRSPGGGNGNPLQYFGWDNPVDRDKCLFSSSAYLKIFFSILCCTDVLVWTILNVFI